MVGTGVSPVSWSKCISSGETKSCAVCAVFIGGPASQASSVVDLDINFSPLDEIAASLCRDGAFAESEWANSDAIECELGCGTIYCGEECRRIAVDAGHMMLCVGPHSEEHPLYRFRMLAFETEVYDEFMLAAQVHVLCKVNAGVRSAVAPHVASAVLWQQHSANAEESAEMAEAVKVSWQLLSDGISTFDDGSHSVDDNEEWWGKLLGLVVQRSTRFELQSPLERLCVAVHDRIGLEFVSGETRAALLACRDVNSSLEGGDEEDLVEDDCEEEILPASQRLAQMLAQPELYCPRLEGLAFHVVGLGLPHSCIPSHLLTVKHSAQGLCVNLEPVKEATLGQSCGTPCVSLLTERGDVDERRDFLSSMGLPACECLRCRVEEAGDSLEEFSNEDILLLANVAQAEDRYTDALLLHDEILRRNERDANSLFARHRLLGWNDQHEMAYECLCKAFQVAPEHGDIARNMRLLDAYAKGSTNGRSDGANTGSSFVNGMAFMSLDVLDATECAEMVRVAEDYHSDGKSWSTARHYSVPTTDVAINSIPRILKWFNRMLTDCIYPMLAEQYADVHESELRVIDAFLVKYNAEEQRSLPLHCDQSEYSLTIAMNSLSEYSGGGTFFADTGEVLKTDIGGVVSFKGSLLHAGHPITRGQRYVIAAFLYCHRDRQ